MNISTSSPSSTNFYQPADTFFQNNLPTGLTFDDLSMATLYSESCRARCVLFGNKFDKSSLSVSDRTPEYSDFSLRNLFTVKTMTYSR